MRDLRIKRARSKRSRRTALALLVLAASPTGFAQQPTRSIGPWMPPLPLQSATQGPVRGNPFCEPDEPDFANPVQLASGATSIRLKPVQGEVGLHTIDDPRGHASPPALTLEPAPPQVHQNPLIKSIHHENPDLVDAEVIDQSPQFQSPQLQSPQLLKPQLPFPQPPRAHAAGVAGGEPILFRGGTATVIPNPGSGCVVSSASAGESIPLSPTPVCDLTQASEDDACQQAANPAGEEQRRSSIVLMQPSAPQLLMVEAAADHGPSPVKIVAPAKILSPISEMPQPDAFHEPARLMEAVDAADAASSDIETTEVERVATESVVSEQVEPATVDSVPLDSEPVDSEPVFFSLSDHAEVGTETESITAGESIEAASSQFALDEPLPPMPPIAEDENEPAFFHFADGSTGGDGLDRDGDSRSSQAAPGVDEPFVPRPGKPDARNLDEVALDAALPQPMPEHWDANPGAEANIPLEPLVINAEPSGLATFDDSEWDESRPPLELPEPSAHTSASSPISVPASRKDATVSVEAMPLALESPRSGPSGHDDQPAVAPSTTKILRREAAVVDAVEPVESSRQATRYRPPVAVTSVPITYNRAAGEDDSIEVGPSPRVQAVPEPDLASTRTSQMLAPKTKLTPLFMKSAQVRSLTVAGKLRDIQVADTSVCQAVAAGPSQVKLIGTGNGVTQLVVWAQTDDPAKPFKMRAFEIHVDRVDPSVEAGGSTARLLDESIRNAFPQCEVVLSQEGGELIVSGRCDSDESAEKIIRMIRKTCLVPVQDRLIVR